MLIFTAQFFYQIMRQHSYDEVKDFIPWMCSDCNVKESLRSVSSNQRYCK